MRALRSLMLIPLLAVAAVTAAPAPPASAALSVGISVGIAPPLLPVYEQPVIPGPGYVWTPGYWAWGPEGYYWVPGTWILPPTVGFYWTPPWWGWVDGAYIFNAGYWGPTVGFYGGIDYGFGYFGRGYDGGYWNHGQFFYNRQVNNFGSVRVTNVFDRQVRGNVQTVNRVSFNGGTGGINAQPSAQERTAMSARHVGPTALQQQNVSAARSNPGFRASTNNGRPAVTATSHAGRFNAAAVQIGTTNSVQRDTTNSVQRGTATSLQRGATTSVQHGPTTTSVQHGTTTTSVQHGTTPSVQRGTTATTGTRNFAASGRPVGTPQATLRSTHQNTTVAMPPRAGTQVTPRFTQHQPSAAVSPASPGRFGTGRNASVQHAPSPSVSRSAPAHFGAAPAVHAPAVRNSSGGAPHVSGHAARVQPEKQHQ